jgi:hypothetical protein
MRRGLLLVGLLQLIGLLGSRNADAACTVEFGAQGKSYSQAELAKFVNEQIRPNLTKNPGSFKVTVKSDCGQGNAHSISLTFDATDYYIIEVQNHKLTKEESTYTNADVTLSNGNFNNEIERVLNFDQLQLAQKQDAVKTLAFFLAESARFSEIETIATSIVNNGCSAQWLDYATLLRRWSYISRLAIHQGHTQGTVRGGTSDQLLAPISSQDVSAYNTAIQQGESGPDASYVDKSDWGKKISVPAPSCGK